MTDLNDFFYVDGTDDVMAAYVNNLLAATMRSEYKNIETLSATRTLTDADTPIQRFDCGGASRIVLAAEGDLIENHLFWVVNASDGGEVITLKSFDGVTTLATVNEGEGALIIPDGAGGYLALGVVDLSPYLLRSGLSEWDEQASNPSTPASGKWKLFFKSGGAYIIDDAGVVTGPLGLGGGTSGLPAGWIYGLILSNNTTDATNDVDIATGKCRDSTDAEDIVLASALVKRLDAAWTVGTNQGGLDTGSIADTTYHVWIIKRSDTGVVDVLFSTSATAPTMPANYDYKRRIGSIMRASSAIRLFVQFDDQFLWKTPIQSISTTNQGTSAVTGTLTVPAGVKNLAMVSSAISPTSAATLVYLSSLDQTDTGASNSAFTFGTSSTSLGAYGGYQLIRTNVSSQIRTRLNQSGASTNLYVVTHGYFDTRGK